MRDPKRRRHKAGSLLSPHLAVELPGLLYPLVNPLLGLKIDSAALNSGTRTWCSNPAVDQLFDVLWILPGLQILPKTRLYNSLPSNEQWL
jgi:hypothetical protein